MTPHPVALISLDNILGTLDKNTLASYTGSVLYQMYGHTRYGLSNQSEKSRMLASMIKDFYKTEGHSPKRNLAIHIYIYIYTQ